MFKNKGGVKKGLCCGGIAQYLCKKGYSFLGATGKFLFFLFFFVKIRRSTFLVLPLQILSYNHNKIILLHRQ